MFGFFAHLPDGTEPLSVSDEHQTEILAELETELNEQINEEHQPVTIPEDYKIITPLTGDIIGPGFSLERLTSIVSAIEGLSTEVVEPGQLAELSGLPEDDGWELAIGW